jgi:hypothetical protein
MAQPTTTALRGDIASTDALFFLKPNTIFADVHAYVLAY